MKKSLWIISELFFPNQTSTAFILTHIANALSLKYNINVITATPIVNCTSLNENSLSETIQVNRVKAFKDTNSSSLNKVIKLIIITFRLLFKSLKEIKKSEKIFFVTNPAPFVLFIPFIKWIKKAEVILLVHDVFPENTIPAGILKEGIVYKFFKILFNLSYSSADTLIVLGEDMKEIVSNKIKHNRKNKVRIEVIQNWYEPNIQPLTNLKQNKKIVLQYAGNIGRVQGLVEFVSAIIKANNSNLMFDIWGEGAVEDTLKLIVNKKNFSEKIFFNGSYKRSQQNEILSRANMSIVTLAEGMYGLGVPSKTYNILAAGKPILFIGDERSEVAHMIKKYDIGYVFSNAYDGKLEEFLKYLNEGTIEELKIKGDKARKVAVANYSFDVIMDKFIKVV